MDIRLLGCGTKKKARPEARGRRNQQARSRASIAPRSALLPAQFRLALPHFRAQYMHCVLIFNGFEINYRLEARIHDLLGAFLLAAALVD